jgi:hypothetical protein
MNLSRRCVALFLLGAAAANGKPASAQGAGDIAAAEALFSQGSSLVSAGRYDEGCPKLERAQALVMGIGVTLYVGECYERRGETLRAWQQFTTAEQLASTKGDRRQKVAHDRAERLWPMLAKIKIVVPAASDSVGLVVTDDGNEVPHDAWSTDRPVAAGVHRIRATAPDREPWELSIEVPAGAPPVAVEVPPLRASSSPPSVVAPVVAPAPAAAPVDGPPPPQPPPLSPSAAFSPRRLATLALLGAGAVGIGLGTAFGIDAKSKLDDSNSNGGCRPNDHCNATGISERSDALNSATISTISFIAGSACIAGGVVLLLMSPNREPAVSLLARPQGAGVSLTLQRAW